MVVAALPKRQIGHLNAILRATAVGAGRKPVGNSCLSVGTALAGRCAGDVGGNHIEAIRDGNVALGLGTTAVGGDDLLVGSDGEVEFVAADDAGKEASLAGK